MHVRTLIILSTLLLTSSLSAIRAEGVDISPFSISALPEVRTAYQSRGRIIENRPVSTFLGRAAYEVGPFGKIGLWNWDVSSLGNKRRDVHQRPFNEVDMGIFYHYDWAFDDEGDWTLTNDLLKDWITLNGYRPEYRARKADATISEWRFEQSLKNPYVAPYYLFRRGIQPNDWFYTQIGARKPIALPWNLTFTPIFYVETGNEYHFERRYGKRVDGGRHYHSGAQSTNLKFELAWKMSDNVSFLATLHQFDIVSEDARDAVKAKQTAEARRDLTIFSIGLRARF